MKTITRVEILIDERQPAVVGMLAAPVTVLIGLILACGYRWITDAANDLGKQET